MTPQSSRTQTSSQVPDDEDEEMDFWGGHSPRSADADVELVDVEDTTTSSSDEAMTEDDEEEVEDEIALFGHR